MVVGTGQCRQVGLDPTGVLEVDRLIPASSSTELRGVVRQTISAWQRMSTPTRPLGCRMSLSREVMQRLESLVDPNLDEQRLDQASVLPLQPLDTDLDDSLKRLSNCRCWDCWSASTHES